MLQSNKNGAAQMVTRPLPARRPVHKKQALMTGTTSKRAAAKCCQRTGYSGTAWVSFTVSIGTSVFTLCTLAIRVSCSA